MSAGAVPIVIGLAGQIETVRDGVDGFHFSSLRQLVDRTRSLIDDPDRLSRMSASARARSQQYSVPAFSERLRELAAGLDEQ
jgi:glycosyltransferase involved in cell wall biosynthesis